MARHRNTNPPKSAPLTRLAPARPREGWDRPWEGIHPMKPWDYQVAVAIPHLDTSEQLETIIRLYNLQTLRPFIMILDTGSLDHHIQELHRLEAIYENVEVHKIRLQGVIHPSDPPAMAMDLAMTLCRSPYLYCSHADVFPVRRDLLEWFVQLGQEHKIAGYEITPRKGIAWQGMVSHTATIIEMAWADQVGLAWSQRRLCNMVGRPWQEPKPETGSFPDTEVCMNYIMRAIDFQPFLVGSEKNYERTLDDNIDHIRSFPSSKQYSKQHHDKALPWMEDAMAMAKERIEAWRHYLLSE